MLAADRRNGRMRVQPNAAGMPKTHLFVSPRVTKYSRLLDSVRSKVSDDPTAAKMAALLDQVDQGEISALIKLQEEMAAKDAWLQAVAETRRLALTALDWKVVPGDEGPLAEMAAKWVGESLAQVATFDTTLEHLSTAIGPNVAAAELLWDMRANLGGMVDVAGHRLVTRPWQDNEVYIRTDDNPALGVKMERGKFLVFHHEENAGFPFRKTKTHASVFPFLVKHFSRADWMAFSELYGIPWRWAETTDEVGDDDRETAKNIMEQLSSDYNGVFPQGVQMKTMEIGDRSGQTFVNQIDWANKSLSVLWLGQALTTDVGDRGSFAAAKVHDNVRADLLMADIKRERRALRQNLFGPMIWHKFPGVDMPLPQFERELFRRRDVEGERLDLDQVRTAREMRLPMRKEQVYEKLQLDRPEDGEETA